MVFLTEGKPADYGKATYPLFVRGQILEAEQLAEVLETAEGEGMLRKHLRGREVTEEAIEELIDEYSQRESISRV